MPENKMWKCGACGFQPGPSVDAANWNHCPVCGAAVSDHEPGGPSSGTDFGSKPILSPDGKTVTYGLYPQRRVGDPDLIAALDAIPSPESNGFFLHKGTYYAKTVANPRAFDSLFADGTPIARGDVHWFECEPIRWKVLFAKNGVHLLLSETILDAHCFDADRPGERYCSFSNDYSDSMIREWLNGEFYDSAFALADPVIMTATVKNGAQTTESTKNVYACKDTKDKVFLLSYKDFLDLSYGFTSTVGASEIRRAAFTDWALARGIDETEIVDGERRGTYLTRSPYFYSFDFRSIWVVSRGGGIEGEFSPNLTHGVRPAIMIRLPLSEAIAEEALPAQTPNRDADAVERGTKPVLSPDKKTVVFGLYPQKRVGDPELIAALDAIPSPESNGFYFHQGVYYAKTIATPWLSEHVFVDGSPIVEGTAYWFECEPIRWRVLDAKDDKYLILSDMVLDVHRFDEDKEDYADSEIRKWLNGEFFEAAFALSDRVIQVADVDHGVTTAESVKDPYGCDLNLDGVFLLARSDYLNLSYGFSTTEDSLRARRAKTTDWARARGAWNTRTERSLDNGWYWTRSRTYERFSPVCTVYHDGSLTGYWPDQRQIGIRPAIIVKIASAATVEGTVDTEEPIRVPATPEGNPDGANALDTPLSEPIMDAVPEAESRQEGNDEEPVLPSETPNEEPEEADSSPADVAPAIEVQSESRQEEGDAEPVFPSETPIDDSVEIREVEPAPAEPSEDVDAAAEIQPEPRKEGTDTEPIPAAETERERPDDTREPDPSPAEPSEVSTPPEEPKPRLRPWVWNGPIDKPVLFSDRRTIVYGFYPQKRVGDPDLIAVLSAIPSPEGNGYYLYQGKYYARTVARPHYKNYAFDDGTKIFEGTMYWFECEPIRWRVLSAHEGIYRVWSDMVLDAHRFDGKSNDYAGSEVRAWLNGEFYRSAFCFGDSEVLITDVDNSGKTTAYRRNENACANTRDKVFMLSYRDCLGIARTIAPSKARCAKATDWARARNIMCDRFERDESYNALYWTRSPTIGADRLYALIVDETGTTGCCDPITSEYIGVRPLITIKIG